MPSRQDQLHSYQFSVQRVVSALVMRETDPSQSPFRRAAAATLASVLIAAIVAAGFGVYGVFSNRGDDKWRQDGAVVVEKETGAKYVYRDGKLLPALNLASAMLASGAGRPVVQVSRESLTGVQRGQLLGIANLPDSLPASDRLLGTPWSVCATRVDNRPATVLALGDEAIAAGGRALASDEGFLVRAMTRAGVQVGTFLVWRGRLFPAGAGIGSALYANRQPVSVPVSFVNAMVKGPNLAALPITGAGTMSPGMPGQLIGKVVSTKNIDQSLQYAVVRGDGLGLITQVQAAILLGEFSQQYQLGGILEIDQTEFSRYQKADLRPNSADPFQPPDVLPKYVAPPAGGICAVLRDESGVAEVRTEVPVDVTGRAATAGAGADRQQYADYVLVPPGRGALVASGLTQLLVTDQGVAFALARPEVAAMLGFEGKAATKLPSSVVALLPRGPGMDPAEANNSRLVA